MQPRNVVWVPDEEALFCAKCVIGFSLLHRRHHCRMCGKVFCSKCSKNFIQLPELSRFYGDKPVRVCDLCYTSLVSPERVNPRQNEKVISVNSKTEVNNTNPHSLSQNKSYKKEEEIEILNIEDFIDLSSIEESKNAQDIHSPQNNGMVHDSIEVGEMEMMHVAEVKELQLEERLNNDNNDKTNEKNIKHEEKEEITISNLQSNESNSIIVTDDWRRNAENVEMIEALLRTYHIPFQYEVFIPPRDGGVILSEKARNMQQKLFLRYINTYLTQRSINVVSLSELSDGRILAHLIECVFRISVIAPLESSSTHHHQFSEHPSSIENVIANLSLCFQALYINNFSFPQLSIPLIMKGDNDEISKLVWNFIYRAEVERKEFEGTYGIEAIVLWVRSILHSISPNLQFLNFKDNFSDGRIFLSIISKTSFVDFAVLNHDEKIGNLSNAFEYALEKWGIPKLLDPVDVADDPDDVCIIIYLSICFDLIGR